MSSPGCLTKRITRYSEINESRLPIVDAATDHEEKPPPPSRMGIDINRNKERKHTLVEEAQFAAQVVDGTATGGQVILLIKISHLHGMALETPDGEIYWLRVVSLEKESKYDGMFLRLTGSGSNVAIVTKEPPKFLRCQMNDSGHQLFKSWKHPDKTWAFRLVDQESIQEKLKSAPTSNTNLPMWSTVEIREGPDADRGFAFQDDASGSSLSSPSLVNVHSKGWIICEWAYGYPQLFYLTAAYDEAKSLPSFCERVSLVKEQVRGQGEALH